jgi:hypothetical protein
LRHAGPIEAMLLVLQAAILVVLITVLERRGRKAAAESRPADESGEGRIERA